MSYEASLIECCGLIGIYNMTNRTARGIKTEIEECIASEYEVQGCPGHTCNECDDEDCNDGECDCTPEGPGIAIATTNAGQNREGAATALREAGFHATLETENPNSGNRITLWVKDISEGKTPVVMDKPAPAPEPDTELMAALKVYVERNPNPRTRSAQALVSAFKKQFPE